MNLSCEEANYLTKLALSSEGNLATTEKVVLYLPIIMVPMHACTCLL